ncbi:beta-glucosidase [Phaffia rhodozyma]|uniref:Beta-glucosidase n=1 Tax=Phaffia rhodozyma TaxID=264483 RepID=A0A0F7SL92_PHARH|nr:beta-glucosidase [Phaffia rhodozyma]
MYLDDTDRTNYFKGHLDAVKQAILEDGVDVRSYFGWSFSDNFEWASGIKTRFGCVYVDFETMERTVKDSGRFLPQFFRENMSAK